MPLDNSVKYNRISYKILQGLLRILFVIILFLLPFEYLFYGFFDFKSAFFEFGGVMFGILILAIINETIDYKQKFYEILSNENYLKTHQSVILNIGIENPSMVLEQIEAQILNTQSNWLLFHRQIDGIIFKTQRKTFFNSFLEDKILIKIEGNRDVLIESHPINSIEFLDSARNLGNVQLIKRLINSATKSTVY